MRYFTSDKHFGETRLDLFHRDLLNITTEQFDIMLIANFSKLTKLDTLYHLGDVALNEEKIFLLDSLVCKKILIRGNYDMENKVNQKYLEQVFDEIHDELEIEIDGVKMYLNHYPTKCKDDMFNLTGHIHGLWKVQKNMINVGCDTWHFKPVSEKKIMFTYNAIQKYYDDNVFPQNIIKDE